MPYKVLNLTDGILRLVTAHTNELDATAYRVFNDMIIETVNASGRVPDVRVHEGERYVFIDAIIDDTSDNFLSLKILRRLAKEERLTLFSDYNAFYAELEFDHVEIRLTWAVFD